MKRRLVLLVTITLAFAAIGSTAWAQESKESVPPSTASDQPIPLPAESGPFVGQVTLINGDEPVEAARPGLDLIMSVQLLGRTDASDVSLDLQSVDAGVRLVETKADYNPYDPEGTSRNFHFSFAESLCPTDIITFVGTIHTSDGDQGTKFAVPADCPGPRLYTQEVRYTGGDGDGVPEPGEKLNVFVTLSNQGRDPATDVTGTLKITGGDVSIVDGTASWPNIPAGEAKENTTSFVVQVSQDAKPSDCGGIAVTDGPPPVDGGGSSTGSSGSGSNETTISSDGTVSSDGSVTVEPAGSASAEPGSVEPQPAIVEPEPGTIEPAPDGTTEPAPEPPATSDTAVDFQGVIAVNASSQTFNVDFFNGFACARAGIEYQNGAALGAPVAADTAEKAASTSGSGSPLYLIVVLVAAAGSLVWRYRFSS